MTIKHSLVINILVAGLLLFSTYIYFFGIDRVFYGGIHFASRSYFGSHINYAGLQIELPARWSKNFIGKHFSLIRSPDDAFNELVFVIIDEESVIPVDFDRSWKIESEIVNGMKYIGVREFSGYKYMFAIFGDCIHSDDKPCDFLRYIPSRSSATINVSGLKKNEAWVVEELLKNIVVTDESNSKD